MTDNTKIPPDLISERPFKQGEAFWLIQDWVPIYALTMVLGMVASIITIYFFWRREGYKFDYLAILIFITVPVSIIGARFGFILERLFYGDFNSLKNWYNIRSGGLSIQWGVFFPTFANLIYIYRKRSILDWRKCFSIILPAVLVGQFIGRWGNFTNHEVYGHLDPEGTTVNWLGSFIYKNMFISDEIAPDGQLRVPLFFYESLASLFGYLVLVWIFNLFSWLKPGSTGALYIIYYGIVRSSMEFLRQESYLYYFIIAILMVFFGLILFIRFQFLTNYYLKIENKKLKLAFFERYTKEKQKYVNIPWVYWNRNPLNLDTQESKKLVENL
ncbi:prolipoprotein diacylglyceryl transferase [Mesomycoplasma hyopneumoniae]|uniref:Prolipoprotein diacylglyceryl transferase n=2 Tax=Mesomycoplasma hyopneumoniae (strain 168) TaxID=907287 RepID=E4QSA3_MESH1|nr:prolipoprotein diacylglyceryl transferase [Mesomycoplasma hyopneumoniae]ADQ90321.1 Prolipoprotein diacylglyceryl transferase [Mesomycoplasma hyopneumoniae 168]AGM21880.1 Prolipoprotein diacylglyceryl transferase [Mesomycoplasma hyopneumoniae 168-L]OWY73805.1 prolipoprotein diacylglyceryl transferase [Mesomycoplasma hyopneumoniae]